MKELSQLTPQELTVLGLASKGFDNAAISRQLCTTVGTTKTHIRNILSKLEARNRVEAVINGFVSEMITVEESATLPIIQRAEGFEHPSASKLTARELEVLKLMSAGYENPEIAKTLNLTTGTVKTHVRNLLRKLGVTSRLQASIVAYALGLLKQ